MTASMSRLPYPLMVSECLLLLIHICGNQQGGGQIWRTLSGQQVCAQVWEHRVQ